MDHSLESLIALAGVYHNLHEPIPLDIAARLMEHGLIVDELFFHNDSLTRGTD